MLPALHIFHYARVLRGGCGALCTATCNTTTCLHATCRLEHWALLRSITRFKRALPPAFCLPADLLPSPHYLTTAYTTLPTRMTSISPLYLYPFSVLARLRLALLYRQHSAACQRWALRTAVTASASGCFFLHYYHRAIWFLVYYLPAFCFFWTALLAWRALALFTFAYA